MPCRDCPRLSTPGAYQREQCCLPLEPRPANDNTVGASSPLTAEHHQAKRLAANERHPRH